MNISYEALAILLFLSPGLLGISMVRALVYRKKAGVFETIVSALVWSMCIYAIVGLVSDELPVVLIESNLGMQTEYGVRFDQHSIWLAVGLTVFGAILISFSLNKDWAGWLMRKIGITTLSGRVSIWLDVLAEHQTCVVVHLTDQRRVVGWIERYSNSAEEGYFYLALPQWIKDDGSYSEQVSDGIFFTNPKLIDFIEFVPAESSKQKEIKSNARSNKDTPA